jgi:hypothetical protein
MNINVLNIHEYDINSSLYLSVIVIIDELNTPRFKVLDAAIILKNIVINSTSVDKSINKTIFFSISAMMIIGKKKETSRYDLCKEI